MKKVVIGIDVSKSHLDVYISQTNSAFRVPNTQKGLKLFLKKLDALPFIELIVCEATGGYERRLVETCLLAQLPIYRVHANKIRHFAKASGYLAKTDKIDAQRITLFAQTFALENRVNPLEKEVLHLRALTTRRQQLLSEKTRESNRLDVPLPDPLKSSIERHIQWLEAELLKINHEIEIHLKSHPCLQEKVQLMASMPGVGLQTALTLLTDLPEIGKIGFSQLTALVGLAPYNRESGTKRGKRSVFAGRAKVRKALYMAAVASLRVNKKLKFFYDKLKSKGKPSKVALIALARKILQTLNAMILKNLPWSLNYA